MLDRYDQDLLLDYLEGELDADRRAQLDALLAEDPQLAALLGALAADRAALRALPREQAPGDLTHDVTQALERRMLLDDAVVETGPIPIARGRDLPGEAGGGLRWGRIAGLSALAASVALAAGIVVTTLGPDPLTRTAERLADEQDKPTDTLGSAGEAAAGPDALAGERRAGSTPGDNDSAKPERLALDRQPETTDGDTRADGDTPLDAALARRSAIDAGAGVPGTGSNPAAASRPANTPQPAAALAVADLRQQLVLFTEEPELTREQLVAFCVTNGIPIVQTNLAIDTNGAIAGDAPEPGTEPADDPAAQQQPADASYALLVDEATLNKLLVTMNDNAIDDAAAIRRNRLSNQAAVLTDIAPGQFNQAAALTPADAVTNAGPASADAPDAPGRPIELRLPGDLGSSYANSLNRYNFDAEQLRNTSPYQADQANANASIGESPDRLVAPDDASTPAEQFAPGVEAQPRPDALAQGQGNEAPKRATTQDKAIDAPDALEQHADTAPGAASASVGSERSPSATRAAAPDRTRGNWLAPHLPLANTTPILNWRRDQELRAAKLVPIVIQRAPTDQVNSVRLQQQLQYNTPAQAESDRVTDQPDEPEAGETPPAPTDDTADEETGDDDTADKDAANTLEEAAPAEEDASE
ncbi:MAG: hypothetical protein ACE37H_07530 [Phycisphaeraceae bacterium]